MFGFLGVVVSEITERAVLWCAVDAAPFTNETTTTDEVTLWLPAAVAISLTALAFLFVVDAAPAITKPC